MAEKPDRDIPKYYFCSVLLNSFENCFIQINYSYSLMGLLNAGSPVSLAMEIAATWIGFFQ